jgi:hypothetical protein
MAQNRIDRPSGRLHSLVCRHSRRGAGKDSTMFILLKDKPITLASELPLLKIILIFTPFLVISHRLKARGFLIPYRGL